MAKIKQVTDKTLQARVTLYIIDPGGPLKADTPTEDTHRSVACEFVGRCHRGLRRQHGDGYVCGQHGGTRDRGRNDLDAQVAQVSQEGTEYYTLSDVPKGESDAAQPFRKIQVAVNVPGLRVVTRQGYFTSEAPVSQVAVAPKASRPTT